MAFRRLDLSLTLSYYYVLLHYWSLNRLVAFKKKRFLSQAIAITLIER